jgi:hypothetical protein
MVRVRRRLSVFAFALAGAVASRARAQASLEPSTIDTVRGTIKGSTRYIGLAGAFVAIADDTEGVAINPASVAVRLPYSWDPMSFAFGIDLSVAAWLPRNRLYNEPEAAGSSKSRSLFGSVAVLTNYRHVGFGVAAEAEQNEVSRKAQGVSSKLTANFGLVHANVAYGYFGGQLLLGGGLRVVGTSFDATQFEGVKNVGLATAGVGYAAGLIIKPIGAPFRLGGTIEQPINAELEGDAGTGPVSLHVPWTATTGLAYQFGKRTLNPPFVTVADRARKLAAGRHPTADDERKAAEELLDEYEKDRTWYLLVSTELALIEGGGEVALGKFTAIDRPLISPRIGFESEVVPRWLRARTGSYLELPATEEGSARLHGTVGVDAKTFEWDVFGLVHPFDYWQLSLAADVAKSYLNTSFSIGFWH